MINKTSGIVVEKFSPVLGAIITGLMKEKEEEWQLKAISQNKGK